MIVYDLTTAAIAEARSNRNGAGKLEWFCAKLLGARQVQIRDGWYVNAYRWRGKLYLADVVKQ